MIYVKQALEQPPPREAHETTAAQKHLLQALCALGHTVEGYPRLAQLLAARSALAPLLAALELSCECALSPIAPLRLVSAPLPCAPMLWCSQRGVSAIVPPVSLILVLRLLSMPLP